MSIIQYLSEEDKELISSISNTDFDDLVQAIENKPVFNPAHLDSVKYHSLNVKGLHILRVLLADRMTELRRINLGYDKLPYYQEYQENGVVVIHNYMDGKNSVKTLHRNEDFANIVRMITGYNHEFYPNQLISRTLKLEKENMQYDLHIDTFFPIVKIWLYQHKVNEAAFNYVLGSHKSTKLKLEWLYKCSLVKNPPTMAYRLKLTNNIPADLGLQPPQSIVGQKYTLIVANTSGLHKRGHAPNTIRKSWRGRVARHNPFV